MTREDLLKGNCEIAEDFGKKIRKYCPDVKHVVIIFNPADITGLVVLLHSGLRPEQVTTLAALDSTRLQAAIAEACGVPQHKITNAYTYGGHGEAMAAFGEQAMVDGKPISEYNLSEKQWEKIRQATIQGGAIIMRFRGRSSFQSPAYNAVRMMQAAMGGELFTRPCGSYVKYGEFANVMMAMPSRLDETGVHIAQPVGNPDEMAALKASYEHLCKMRDRIIELGIIPPVADWKKLNPNL